MIEPHAPPCSGGKLSDQEVSSWRPTEECICLRCGGSAFRMPLRIRDMPLNWFVRIKRFRCREMGCQWRGNLRARDHPTVPGSSGWR